jgi:hypothetical protein
MAYLSKHFFAYRFTKHNRDRRRRIACALIGIKTVLADKTAQMHFVGNLWFCLATSFDIQFLGDGFDGEYFL